MTAAEVAGTAAAEPPGYVDQYPPDASLDKRAVDARMRESFLSEEFNKDLRDRFRARFTSAIDDVDNAATARDRDAAIERYNQTARDYNAAELVERDNFAGHPTDAHGRTLRAEPKAMSDPDAAPNQLPDHYGQDQDLQVLHQSAGDFGAGADGF